MTRFRPTRQPAARTTPARHRLGVELLEDRAVPSVSFGSALAATPPDGFPGSSSGEAVAVDLHNNSYVVGSFAGTVDFNPDPTVSNTLSGPSYTDSNGQTVYAQNAYVAKYGSDGSLAWVQGFGNADGFGERSLAVAVDGHGNAYVVGQFSGTVDLGGKTLNADGESDAFAARFNPDGTVEWAKRVGGTYRDSLNGVAVHTTQDGSVGVYATGETWKTSSSVDADIDVIVHKWGAEDGTSAWTAQIGGSLSDLGAAVATDATGNAYITGEFHGTVDFDPGSGTQTLFSGGRKQSPTGAAYVLKLDAAGGFGWVRQFTGASGQAVAVDPSGSVYSAGDFGGTVDFDPASGKQNTYTLTSAGSTDVYVSRLTANGSFVWARQLGGSDMDRVWGMAVDGAGAVYLGGNFAGTADFDPGAGPFEMTASGNYDAYVAKLDADGSLAWAVQVEGTGAETAHGVAIDPNGDVRVTGGFSGTADFEPGSGESLLTAPYTSMFLWTLDQQ